MITKIRQKIRALVNDFASKSTEAFTFVSGYNFTIAQSNITITSVTLDGVTLTEATDYDYVEATGVLTLTASALSGDILQVNYNYYKYSNSELDEYIRAALVWISIFSYETFDYELESGDAIVPTPDNRTTDLIAIIGSILINPDYAQYKLPTINVIYNGRLPREQKIEKLLSKYNFGLGVADVIEYDIDTNPIY